MTKTWYDKDKVDQLLGFKVNVSDAVSLSSAAGSPATSAGFAGTANNAARGDHSHPITRGIPYPFTGATGAWTFPMGGQSGTQSVANVKCPVVPWPVARRQTVETIAFRPYTAGDAGNCKIAIYATTSDGFGNGVPIFTSAALGVTAGNKEATGLSLVLDPGLYWLAIGAYGWSTTRMNPRGLDPYGYASMWMPTVPPAPSAPDIVPGIALTGFNEASGAFPTLTGAVSDLVVNPGTTAIWFAIKASAA